MGECKILSPLPTKDLTGQRFQRLLVIRRDGTDRHHKVKWLCQCDCGNTKSINAACLLKGITRSCGCLQKETMSKIRTTHGCSSTVEHETWRSMIWRCNHNPDYYLRGIKVCDEWKDFFVFKNYMNSVLGPRPCGHSMDRVNNDGNYEPGNIRWATRSVQQTNQRRPRRKSK